MLMASMIASMIQDVASTPSGLPCGWVPQHRMNCSISSWEIATCSSLFKLVQAMFKLFLWGVGSIFLDAVHWIG
jgi:hypothetical protein